MTKEMEKQIKELRQKGLGYKSIGLVVGTSKETVRYYCKTHGLDGHGKEIKTQWEENHKNNPDNCKYCGCFIIRNPRSGKKLFCSDECRRAWWRKHPEESARSQEAYYEIECGYCKKVFYTYGNKNRKYCSHNCYIMHRFWSEKAGKDKPKSNRKIITIDIDGNIGL